MVVFRAEVQDAVDHRGCAGNRGLRGEVPEQGLIIIGAGRRRGPLRGLAWTHALGQVDRISERGHAFLAIGRDACPIERGHPLAQAVQLLIAQIDQHDPGPAFLQDQIEDEDGRTVRQSGQDSHYRGLGRRLPHGVPINTFGPFSDAGKFLIVQIHSHFRHSHKGGYPILREAGHNATPCLHARLIVLSNQDCRNINICYFLLGA